MSDENEPSFLMTKLLSKRIFSFLVIIVILSVGGFATWLEANFANRFMRDIMTAEARMLIQSIDPAKVGRLTGTSKDLLSPDYRDLRNRLIRIREVNPRYRYLYMFGQRPGSPPFFFMGTAPENSSDYSPPGQVYFEDSPTLKHVFTTGEGMVSPPFTDRWGTWISALLPVIDPATGKMLAVFGMDFDAHDWQRLVILRALGPASITLVAIVLFLIIITHFNHRQTKREKELLGESEAKYRFLTDKMNDIIWTGDLYLHISYISPSVEKVLGFKPEEWMKRSPGETMTSESLSSALEVLDSELKREQEEGIDPERTIKLELEFYHNDSSTVWMEQVISAIRDNAGKIIGIHGVSRDINQRKQVEEEKKKLEIQLTQAQKMEAIGTLAGGIAHDFNNILSAIMGYSELAIADISDTARAKSDLDQVLKASNRAKDLVSQILTFSRKTEATYSPLDLHPLIKESLKMLRSVIPTTIEIRQDLIESGLAMSDPTQIHQMMMNLCTNAAHAMDETGGVMTVSLKKVNFDFRAARDLDLSPGPYLMLTVSDTGHGMVPEVLERIFEPYYTTKELGRGTGLGLSVVHGIVKSHRGAITCESAPVKGTSFEVYLPEIEFGKEVVESLKEELLPTGTECILFIDDEPDLVEMFEYMLNKLGYDVVTSTNSSEALKLFEQSPDKFDLVISDMTMPGMTGDKLAHKILEIRHDIPFILCTGYSEHISEKEAKRIGIRMLFMKPIEMKKLALTIRKVLDQG